MLVLLVLLLRGILAHILLCGLFPLFLLLSLLLLLDLFLLLLAVPRLFEGEDVLGRYSYICWFAAEHFLFSFCFLSPSFTVGLLYCSVRPGSCAVNAPNWDGCGVGLMEDAR